ncbi:MAG: peptidase T4, partial [Aurantimonas coralicida]
TGTSGIGPAPIDRMELAAAAAATMARAIARGVSAANATAYDRLPVWSTA